MTKSSSTKIIGQRAMVRARDLIALAEHNTGTTLSAAQRTAVLKEKTVWSTDFCLEVVSAIAARDRTYHDKVMSTKPDLNHDADEFWRRIENDEMEAERRDFDC